MNCSVEGSVEGYPYTGGLVGRNEGEVSHSTANVAVNGSSRVGGLIGFNNGAQAKVDNSYSLGKVTGTSSVGGLIGWNLNDAFLSNSYSASIVNGDNSVGGLIGENCCNTEYTYWDSTINTNLSSVGIGLITDIDGLTTEQMTGDSAFYYMSNLDFENTWLLTEGYPALYWEDVESITPPEVDPPNAVNLLKPENNATDVAADTTLIWSSVGANSYELQVSVDSLFSSPIFSEIEIPDTTFTLSGQLNFGTNYYWRVRGTNLVGAGAWSDTSSFTTGVSTSNEESSKLPNEFSLQQNYPNPFNPTTQIRYGIPQAAEVELSVFNMLGQKVTTLVNKKQSAGWHTATFDASTLSSGFYIYRIQAGEFVSTKKLMLIK